MELNHTGESINGLFRNKVRVIQARRGYRVSEDAIILTWFAGPNPGGLILDAGTGCGVIAFGLAVRHPSIRVVALEIQEPLADRARRGVQLNGLDDRILVVRGDVRKADRLFQNGFFDAVVSNPPYYEPGRGRINLEHEKALSRHQLMMPLTDLFRVSGALLKPSGNLSLIYPAGGRGKIDEAMKAAGFKPSRVLWIHPQKGTEPGLICVEARPQAFRPELREEHLYLYSGPGKRSREAEAILAGEEFPEIPEGTHGVPI
ncbi:MAG: methyltransferase [Desulfomonilaceae bacterium]|nr:methyltransferase [Desulfomonilaceae bacterium]